MKKRIRKAYCRPDLMVGSIEELDPGWLAERGIRLLILDVDHTLVGMDQDTLSGATMDYFARLEEKGITPVLATNNFSARIRTLKKQEGLPEMHMLAAKPFGFVFSRIRRNHGLEPDQMAIAGDQLLSDILGGARAGLTTVLITSRKGRQRPDQKIAGMIDRVILRHVLKESP